MLFVVEYLRPISEVRLPRYTQYQGRLANLTHSITLTIAICNCLIWMSVDTDSGAKCNVNVNNKFIERTGTRVSNILRCHL